MTTSDFNREQVARSFSKAAHTYDQFAVLQQEVAARLLDKLALMNISPSKIVDVGCGTGEVTRELKKRFKRAEVVGLDIAQGMVDFARSKNSWLKRCQYVESDMHNMPFDKGTVDLVVSNLAFQWTDDMQQLLKEMRRVLSPGGLLIYSTLGPDTLCELRAAWAAADNQQHVNRFIDMHDWGDAMLNAKFADPVMDMESIQMTYPKLRDLFNDLKGIGAHNVNHAAPKSLMSKSVWQRMLDSYEAMRNQEGLYPATYEVIFGHGWAIEKAPKQSDPTIYKVSL